MSVVSYEKYQKSARFDAEFYHHEKINVEKKLSKFSSTIGDFFIPVKKIVKPGGQNEIQLIDLDNVEQFRIRSPKKLKGWELGSTKKEIKKNDLIISRLRSYLKQVAINPNFQSLLGSTELIVLREKKSSKINSETLFGFLLTGYVQTILKWSQEGSNHPRFSETLLLSINIPIFSKSVQETVKKKIVESNSLFVSAISKFIKAKNIVDSELNLSTIDKKIKKVNIIDHNEFTSETRFDGQYFSSKNFKTIFSEKFETEPLNVLCKDIDTGSTPDKEQYWNKGFPILKMGCLTNSGIDWSKIEFVVKEHYEKAKKYSVKNEDIYFTSSAHSLEHIAKKVDIVYGIPPKLKKDLTFVAEIMRLRPIRSKINPYYLWVFLQTEIGYKIILNCIRGQTAHVYPKDIREIEIPLIDSKKQIQIENLLIKYFDLMEKSSKLILDSVSLIEQKLD